MSPRRSRNAHASAIASSIASLVPEPIEKCAVCAASPSSTTFPWRQRALRTVTKLIQQRAVLDQAVAVEVGEQLLADREALVLARASRPAAPRLVVVSTMNVLIVSL